MKKMKVFGVSHSMCGREEETRGETWRCVVGSELLGTRQEAGGGEVGVQRLETGLGAPSATPCGINYVTLCYSWTIPGLSVNLQSLVLTMLWAFEKRASALETHVAVEGELRAMHGHVSMPPGVPEPTRGKAPGERKDNPSERERGFDFGSLDIEGHLVIV